MEATNTTTTPAPATQRAPDTGTFERLAQVWPMLDPDGRAVLAHVAGVLLGEPMASNGAGQLADFGAGWHRLAEKDRTALGRTAEAFACFGVLRSVDGTSTMDRPHGAEAIDAALTRLERAGLPTCIVCP
ncbi:MAG: hypothetical protein H6809_04875 [Phycisphaeraceae bacterium]|nr:hypothetical protein [Phycisphaeraceae bacterium]